MLRCEACDVSFMGRAGDDCPKCGARVGVRVGLPWQDRAGKGYTALGALWRTFWRLQKRPRIAFLEFRPEQGYGEPVGYVVLAMTAVYASAAAQYYVVARVLAGAAPWPDARQAVVLVGLGLVFSLIAAMLTPLLCLVAAAVLQAVLRLFGARGAPHEETFAVLAYSLAPPLLWLVLPVVGWFSVLLWLVVLPVVGLATVHRTGLLRAALTLLTTAALFTGATALVVYLVWRPW